MAAAEWYTLDEESSLTRVTVDGKRLTVGGEAQQLTKDQVERVEALEATLKPSKKPDSPANDPDNNDS